MHLLVRSEPFGGVSARAKNSNQAQSFAQTGSIITPHAAAGRQHPPPHMSELRGHRLAFHCNSNISVLPSGSALEIDAGHCQGRFYLWLHSIIEKQAFKIWPRKACFLTCITARLINPRALTLLRI